MPKNSLSELSSSANADQLRTRREAKVVTFGSEIRFNDSHDMPVVPLYEPALSDGSAARNAGVVIQGITDGFSGRAPDIGAVIAGRPLSRVGDRTK